MASDDVIFVKYVPPPQDEEVWVISVPIQERVDWNMEFPYVEPEPTTPLWTDMWEDIDDDPSADFKE